MDSLRQTIFDAVLARLRLIKTASGYATNLGDQVFGWRSNIPWEDAELIEGACNVKDAIEEAEEGSIQPHTHDKQLEIEIEFATAKPNPETAAQLRRILADINKAIGVDRTWGGNARNTGPVSSEIDVGQAGKIYGGGSAKFTIFYRHQSFDTYTK